MPAPTPYNGREVILAILNERDSSNILLADVSFGTTERADEVLDGVTGVALYPVGQVPPRNTRLKLTPVITSGYYGIKTLWYNRIHKSELGEIKVVRDDETTFAQILPLINEKYGLFLSVDDIVDGPLGTSVVGEITVDLPINPASLFFYSGTIIVSEDIP